MSNNFRFRLRDWCTCLVICKGAFPIASALNADPDISIARLKRPAKDGKTINGPTLSRSRYLHARQILSFSFYSIIIDRISRRYSLRPVPPLKNDRRILVSFLACKERIILPRWLYKKIQRVFRERVQSLDFIAIFNGNRELRKNLECPIVKDLFHLRDSQMSARRIQFYLIQRFENYFHS